MAILRFWKTWITWIRPKTKISDILPERGEAFRFLYEYDFGDGWEHEVLFEGIAELLPSRRYPLCLDGERACPPEDCGGIPGYEEYVAAITDPKHKQHREFLRWSGPFDPDAFDAEEATKAMRKGLPDWRTG